MNLPAIIHRFARKVRSYAAIVIFATLVVPFSSPRCWAVQNINVGISDNLQALVNNNPAGTTFSLLPGIHRFQSVTPKDNDAFVGQPGAILSGAALLTSYSRVGSYWISHVSVRKAAAYPGQCKSASPACIYPEDLFFDNTPKTRVPSLSSMKPGRWYLDYNTGSVYMADSPYGHTVELSLSRYAFTGSASYVTISNLVVEKYACPAQSAAIDGSNGSNYWQIGGSEIRYNHGRGISTGNGMYVHNNTIHNNGQLGIGGVGTNVTVQNNEISYNNYSGYSFYWEAGGAKFAYAQSVTFRYNYSHHNGGPGFWTDLNSEGILCDQNQFTANTEAAVMIELSSYVTVSSNYIWNDGFNADGSNPWWGDAIMISNSSNVSVYFNRVTNCMNGIVGIMQSRGNGPNGQPYLLQSVDVNSNTITQSTGIAAGIVVASGYGNSVYTSWNNTFQPNTYVLANPSGAYFYWMGETLTLNSFTSMLVAQ